MGIELPGGRSCGTAGAVCTASGKVLSNSASATVAGPPAEVSIAADAASVAEGSPAAYTLTRTGDAAQALTVALAVTETGAVALGALPTGAVIAAGASTAALTVATDDDSVIEADGTVRVALAAGDGYEVSASAGVAEVSVTDDDTAAWSVAASADTLQEGGSATLTVSLTNGTTFADEQSVALTVSGTATADDYVLSPASLTLAAARRPLRRRSPLWTTRTRRTRRRW